MNNLITLHSRTQAFFFIIIKYILGLFNCLKKKLFNTLAKQKNQNTLKSDTIYLSNKTQAPEKNSFLRMFYTNLQ